MAPPSSPSEWASGRGLSGTQRTFSDPLHRFQMLVNLPALFLSALSSRPRALRLLMAVRRGSAFPVPPFLRPPIKGLSAGDGARCPPPAPRASFLSTFSQVSRAPHPPVCPPWSWRSSAGRRGSKRPSVARGAGSAVRGGGSLLISGGGLCKRDDRTTNAPQPGRLFSIPGAAFSGSSGGDSGGVIDDVIGPKVPLIGGNCGL